MYRSYSLRLRPTKRQQRALEGILGLSCDLYNAAIQERRDAWNVRRENINYKHQQRELTEIRADDPDVRAVAADIAREPLRRVDRAFRAFFSRCKRGEKPGYPRFKAKSRYDSFGFNAPHIRIRNNILMVPNFGGLRFKTTQDMKGIAKTVTIKRHRKRWMACIICDIGPAPEKRAVSVAIGIDLGLTNFVTLSDGGVINNPRYLRQHEKRIAVANQILALKQKRSRNHKRAGFALNRRYERLRNTRRDFAHHVSKWLVANFDLIAYEKLNIKGMAHGNLAKSILDAAWGELIWQLSYKAESAGRWAVPVNPRDTTIDCSECGERVPKRLRDRIHRCPHCGLTICRDRNAAINILKRGLGVSPVGPIPPERLLVASK